MPRSSLQSSVHAVAEQERVATSRGELPTEGHTTMDAEAGLTMMDAALLRFGVRNVFDKDYVSHLKAKNPFTALQLLEPGRVVFARVSYAF
ncbi:MAG: hypothetical protein GEU90_13680 [Gemmatimonas sp.]|nr:hypothetical protein [Gemmatimonas sp.]